MKAYYNEINPTAIKWLQASMDAGVIAAGDIDTRSIEDVKPTELMGYTQCHFFAGIGGWSIALRRAGWPDNRPVWTGSCPCQSFSTAGKGLGRNDPRHLWPSWFWLIQQCRPSVVFGEQVANAITHGWWDDVATDLEAEGYAVGASIIPACSVGAPHKRDRLWFVADSQNQQRNERIGGVNSGARWGAEGATGTNGSPCSAMGDAEGIRSGEGFEDSAWGAEGSNARKVAIFKQSSVEHVAKPAILGLCSEANKQELEGERTDKLQSEQSRDTPEFVANAELPRLERHGRHEQQHGAEGWQEQNGYSGAADLHWLPCPDGKQRLVESSIRLLVDGLPSRLRKAALHGYGNAIVPEVAAEFIKASDNWRNK